MTRKEELLVILMEECAEVQQEDVGYFAGEESWEQERLLQLLKRKKKNEPY